MGWPKAGQYLTFPPSSIGFLLGSGRLFELHQIFVHTFHNVGPHHFHFNSVISEIERFLQVTGWLRKIIPISAIFFIHVIHFFALFADLKKKHVVGLVISLDTEHGRSLIFKSKELAEVFSSSRVSRFISYLWTKVCTAYSC